MLRIACLTLFAALLLPTGSAAAAPTVGVAVGPDGIVDPARDPDASYWIWAIVGAPSVPHEGTPEDDCAAQRRPMGLSAVNGLADDLATWKPLEVFSTAHWFPECFALASPSFCTPPGVCTGSAVPASAYAAYDFSTGQYYVEAKARIPGAAGLPVSIGPDLHAQNAEETIAAGGNSGIILQADCEACPPPP